MLNNSKPKMVDKIINLTGEVIRVYDDATGEIVEFLPNALQPKAPVYDGCGHPQLYYIVEPLAVEKIRESGRTLEDIAMVLSTGGGRGGVMVSTLMSAEDSKVLIRYRRKAISGFYAA